MVQTVGSQTLFAGQQKIFFVKPDVLRRIFFGITVLRQPTEDYNSAVSFDDPLFYSFYVLRGLNTHFESKGEGIFQGNIWVRNASTMTNYYTMTEILI